MKVWCSDSNTFLITSPAIKFDCATGANVHCLSVIRHNNGRFSKREQKGLRYDCPMFSGLTPYPLTTIFGCFHSYDVSEQPPSRIFVEGNTRDGFWTERIITTVQNCCDEKYPQNSSFAKTSIEYDVSQCHGAIERFCFMKIPRKHQVKEAQNSTAGREPCLHLLNQAPGSLDGLPIRTREGKSNPHMRSGRCSLCAPSVLFVYGVV